MNNFARLSYYFKTYRAGLLALVGSFVIASGWGLYHFDKHHIPFLIAKIFAVAFVVYSAYQFGKFVFVYATKYLKRHPFWYEEFVHFLDQIFFFFSLFFVMFLFHSELVSIVYTSVVLLLFFWRVHVYIMHHPEAASWGRVNKSMCILVFFIFLLQALFQYSAYRYYILDSNIKYFNIVIFRSVAMTLFWLFGFSVASIIYWQIKHWLKYLAFAVWGLCFGAGLLFWVMNIGILYYSGLYLSPTALDHLQGSGEVVANNVTYILVAGFVLVVLLFVSMVRDVVKAHKHTSARYWYFYNAAIIMLAVLSFVGLSSFKNTPERVVFKSFYDRFFGKEELMTLPKELQKKLERFGLFYNDEAFAVAHKETIFSTSTKKILLPDRLQTKRPNIVFIFFEGFSARLTSVYNDKFGNVTPNLVRMAQDRHTTVFKNFFNASTPTITGTLSQLCSFLPPFGHNEIQNERKLQSHRLLCLPKILKDQAGYGYSAYITAVDKDFAHKDGIFTSMGVDEVLGTKELKQYVPNPPLSWGYSDHQMFPVLSRVIGEHADNKKPFITMLATVDTHPPFNLSKDEIKYGDGSQSVLNTFYTSDDAFGKFWDEFTKSPLYNNTIVVAVADHAIFPGAITTDLFPQEKNTLSYYDQNMFMMYIPDSVLPKEVNMYASGIDVAPTILHILGVNSPNAFEGHSIFDTRSTYPNLVGMHELGLYINQVVGEQGKRKTDYTVPDTLECNFSNSVSSTQPLTLCELFHFYKWKRQMFEQGRLWETGN